MLLRCILLLSIIKLFVASAQAQTPSLGPQDIQALIANGNQSAAVAALEPIIAAQPNSGIAWYLMAEAQDASGNTAAARNALVIAQKLAPGLPFAKPEAVAALQAHLNGNGESTSSGLALHPDIMLKPVFPYSNPLIVDVSCKDVLDVISHHQDDGIMNYYQDDLSLTVDHAVLIGGLGNLSMVSRDGTLFRAVYQECVSHPDLYLGQATAIIYDQEMNIKPQYFPPIFTLNIYNGR